MLFIFGQKQAFDCASGQCSESIVSGSKYGEGTFAAQSLGQTCSLHSSHEGCEASVSNSDVNNGVLFFHHGIFGRRQEDCIDHMDDAVGGLDVGDDDF